MSERASRSCGVDAGLADVAAKQPQRLARQAVGDDVLLVLRGVGLDGVHHRVDAGGGGDGGGKADGQLGVEDRPVGQELRRDDALLLGGAGGDDRDRRDLGAGAGGGRREHQRQPLALDQADAVDVADRLVRAGEHRDELRGVERAAAADRHDAVDALRAGLRRRRRGSSPRADRRRRRRRSRPRRRRRARPLSAGVGEAELQDHRVGDEGDLAAAAAGHDLADLRGGADLAEDRAGGLEGEGPLRGHTSPPVGGGSD